MSLINIFNERELKKLIAWGNFYIKAFNLSLDGSDTDLLKGLIDRYRKLKEVNSKRRKFR